MKLQVKLDSTPRCRPEQKWKRKRKLIAAECRWLTWWCSPTPTTTTGSQERSHIYAPTANPTGCLLFGHYFDFPRIVMMAPRRWLAPLPRFCLQHLNRTVPASSNKMQINILWTIFLQLYGTRELG
ncbi:uncharacterized protein LOC119362291 isoform X1 [Triticum dicoccoides]|uniref:uncharacterized protein LOC119362291 isoform X1 n=1 Tax=Triticum dicoccoides TaxID=85692 RepID=UPI00188F753C|nr:uncharacterized protein LOC119362291 isoform X1 [Triticum dicoccoides]XP_037483386.1 uncharacterized protein LOC119362291 isoform X1 [Triticum dicoccoides]